MKQNFNQTSEDLLNYYIKAIYDIVYSENRWISVVDIATKLKVPRRQNLLPNKKQSTIAHIIDRYLKDKNINHKKIQYRDGYDYWVAPKHVSREKLPNSAWNLYEYRKKLAYNSRVCDKNLQGNAESRFRLIVNNPFVKECLINKDSSQSFVRFSMETDIKITNLNHKCKYNEPMIYSDDYKVFVTPDCKTCFMKHKNYFDRCLKSCCLVKNQFLF